MIEMLVYYLFHSIVFFQVAEWVVMTNLIQAQKGKSVEEITFEQNQKELTSSGQAYDSTKSFCNREK